jgi:hypothetical protein
MRLMSASIAATAVITAVRAAIRTPHGCRETGDPLACSKSLVDQGGGESAREPDPEHDREASDLVFEGHPLTKEFFARDDQRADHVGRQRLHTHVLEKGRCGPNAPAFARASSE